MFLYERLVQTVSIDIICQSAHRGEALTGQDGGHERGEHEEEHGEEEEPRVVEDLAGVVADLQVEQADQHAHAYVGHDSQVSQHLRDEEHVSMHDHWWWSHVKAM